MNPPAAGPADARPSVRPSASASAQPLLRLDATAPLLVALLGAESTGKTSLAIALADRLRARGCRAECVPEVLREWCAREGRTPRPEEQLPIAIEQERRVDDAAARVGANGLVVADTTALMTAIYSAMLFEDGALLVFARERQRRYDLTLVTGLDIAWVADGLQRDGPHVREPVDALVRRELSAAGVDYAVIYGQGEARTDAAFALIDRARAAANDRSPSSGETGVASSDADTGGASQDLVSDDRAVGPRYACAQCGDAACEHRLFRALKR